VERGAGEHDPSPITLTVEFPASGTVPQTAETVLYTNGITDNAENSNDVLRRCATGRSHHLGPERHPHSPTLLHHRYSLTRRPPVRIDTDAKRRDALSLQTLGECFECAEWIGPLKARGMAPFRANLAIPRPQRTVAREISEKIRNPAILASLRDALQMADPRVPASRQCRPP